MVIAEAIVKVIATVTVTVTVIAMGMEMTITVHLLAEPASSEICTKPNHIQTNLMYRNHHGVCHTHTAHQTSIVNDVHLVSPETPTLRIWGCHMAIAVPRHRSSRVYHRVTSSALVLLMVIGGRVLQMGLGVLARLTASDVSVHLMNSDALVLQMGPG